MKKIKLPIILLITVCICFATSCKKETKEIETIDASLKLPSITFENDTIEYSVSNSQQLSKKIIFFAGYAYKSISIYRKKNNIENLIYELTKLDTNTKHNYTFNYKIQNEDYKDNNLKPNNKLEFRFEIVDMQNNKIEKKLTIYLKHNKIKTISNIRLGASNHILGSFFGINTSLIYNMTNVNQNTNNIDFVYDYLTGNLLGHYIYSPEKYNFFPIIGKKTKFFPLSSINNQTFDKIMNNDSIILLNYFNNLYNNEYDKLKLNTTTPFFAIRTNENKIGIIKIESFENESPNELGNSIKFSLKVQE